MLYYVFLYHIWQEITIYNFKSQVVNLKYFYSALSGVGILTGCNIIICNRFYGGTACDFGYPSQSRHL